MSSPWFPRWLKPGRTPPARRPRLTVTGLEDRVTPSYTPAAATYRDFVGAGGFSTAISGTSSAANDATAAVPLGGSNTFNFYGTAYSTVYVGTNGFISIGSDFPTPNAANTDLSVTPETQGIIAPLWDDWFLPTTGTTVQYKVDTIANEMIVRWGPMNSPSVSPLYTSTVEFYAVLKLNTSTTPGGIEFHYADTIADPGTGSGRDVVDDGASATVGVKRPGIADSSPNETETRTLISFDTAGGLIGSGKGIALTWTNTPPVTGTDLTLSSSSINEGGTLTLGGSFTDTNDIDPHDVTIDWGDGTTPTTFTLAVGVSTFSNITHTYADNPAGQVNGSYTITVTIADRTQSTAVNASVQVKNVAPAITAGTNVSINEGTLFTRNITFTDVSVDGAYSATVDYDDGRGPQAVTLTPGVNSFDISTTFPDDDSNPFTVVVKVTDKDGTVGTATFDVTVLNVNPTIDLATIPDVDLDEGEVLTILPTFSDPGFQNLFPTIDTVETFTYEVDWNDGTAKSVGTATISALGSAGSPTKGTFTASHVYADDGTYTVTVKVFDDDGGVTTRTFTANVSNVAPTLTVPTGAQNTTEGTVISFPNLGLFTDPGFDNAASGQPSKATTERFFYEISWGDGTGVESGDVTTVTQGNTSPTLTSGSFGGSHTYADDGTYTVTVKVTDDDGGFDEKTFTITVANADPVITVAEDQTVLEGSTLSIPTIASFTDLGYNNSLDSPPTSETFTYTVDWGDGTTDSTGSVGTVTQGSAGKPTTGSFGESHTYADNGTYTVTVTVTDDNGGSATDTFQVVVVNAAPVLTVSTNKTVAEGSLLTIAELGSFTDAGFDNALNPVPGGETQEAFDYVINWGDGSTPDSGPVSAGSITQGKPGFATKGTFGGSHTYADNGVYTVTVTLNDDDGGTTQKTFQVTVTNAAPVLSVLSNQTRFEGELLSITNIGTFTDRGYDNASNPGSEKTETFTYTINWGDGTADPVASATIDTMGSAGTPTAGSFDGSHTYADGGLYTVSVTVFDDDGGSATQTFTVEVGNLPPTLSVASDQTRLEGQALTLPSIGTFTDPGFNNPSNPAADKFETFTYTVDWGDGTPNSTGAASITTAGQPGTLTAGSFGGTHTYADDGSYTVTVTLTDDNGGQDQATFQVVVDNVAPSGLTLSPPVAQPTEGTAYSLPVSFTDPGVQDTHTITVEWGDDTPNTVAVLPVGTRSFSGISHTFRDNGSYTATITVADDSGESTSTTRTFTVRNALPTVVIAPIADTRVGRRVSATATVADLGTLDKPTTSWVATDPVGRVVGTGSGTTASFGPVRAGAFTVAFTAVDKDGASTTATAIAQVFTNELLAAGVGGGAGAVQVYNPNLSPKFAVDAFPGFTGGARVATADVTGDGIDDVIAGAGPGGEPIVAVFDGVTGNQLARFRVFEASFTGGTFVAGGDVDGDGLAEVVVTADQGGGPVVAVYRGSELARGRATEVVRFLGIQDNSFFGGSRAAVGDINGDGFADIAVAAGFLGGPRISLWDGKALSTGSAPAQPFANFFAFEDSLRNGAFVAAADVNGDRKADLILGGGPGGGPRVRVVDGAKLLQLGGSGSLDAGLAGSQLANFFAGPSTTTGGVRVAGADLDEDGLAEVITGSGDGVSGVVRLYGGSKILSAPSDPPIATTLTPFDQGLLFGVFVG